MITPIKKDIYFKSVTDVDAAKALWEYFSPHETIDDEWNFRNAFYTYLNFPLFFIVGYHQGKPIGLLPLQFNIGKGPIPKSYGIKKNFYEFFGGDDMDSNTIFLTKGYEDIAPLFFKEIPGEAVLSPLAIPYTYLDNEGEYLTDKFTLNLKKVATFSTFLQDHFDGKKRQKLINNFNKLNKNFTVGIHDGDIDSLNLLFKFNQERFGEASSFHWKYRQQIFRDLMEIYPTDVFTIKLDGEVKAVSYNILYKNTYLSMNIGYDYSVRDLGKLLVATQIERAITTGCTEFDAGKGDNGWKALFHLTPTPQYALSLIKQTPDLSVSIWNNA